MPIQEEDEEEDESGVRGQSFDEREADEESIEEVDQFSPIIRVPGEKIEEIYEEEEAEDGNTVKVEKPVAAGGVVA